MREERNKGRWRRRNSEKSSFQSVKGQQPTLWFHLASSLSVCVRASVCVCLREWKSASVRPDPVYVFVYVSARLWMCVFVHVHACLSVFDCKCMQACIQSQGECVCVHAWGEHESVHRPFGATVCVIAWPVYIHWNKSMGTHLWFWRYVKHPELLSEWVKNFNLIIWALLFRNLPCKAYVQIWGPQAYINLLNKTCLFHYF